MWQKAIITDPDASFTEVWIELKLVTSESGKLGFRSDIGFDIDGEITALMIEPEELYLLDEYAEDVEVKWLSPEDAEGLEVEAIPH